MVDYAINPKYSVIYSYEQTFKSDEESLVKRYNDKYLNPKISFNFKIGSGINESHFFINVFNLQTGEKYYVEFGKDYTENLYDLTFFIYYRCNTTSASSEEKCPLNDDEINRNYVMNIYLITLNYTGHKVDHQNSESPLKQEYIQTDFGLSINDQIYMLRWKTIKYVEERGIAGIFDSWFGITNEYYGGAFMDPLMFNIDISETFKQLEQKGTKVLGFYAMDKNEANNYCDLYSRTKKGIFDPIANICSLALTVYSGFIFVYER